jgi:biotin carboxylase
MKKQPTVLCLSSAYKGVAMIQELKRLGCRVLLIIPQKFADEAWPLDSIDERFIMPNMLDISHVVNAVSYLARSEAIDWVQPLDDYEVDTAATVREHLRLPGMGESATRYFRDKLAMRMRAREVGIAVPEFTATFPHIHVTEFLERVPGPWLLKPRSEAGAMGIKKCETPEEVWRWIHELGDQQSRFLLEQFVPSDVFHADSVVWDGEIKFVTVSGYGKPPLTVSHGGGVFTTRTLDPKDADAQAITAMNADVIRALGLQRGVTHIEFLKSQSDGTLRFLEAAARVGGANISDMIEYGTGINLWSEWARIVVAGLRGEIYALPKLLNQYAGVAICLAKQEHPDLSAYNDAEIVWRLNKPYHAGLIVRSPDASRVHTLLDQYAERFAQDFVNWLPPLETGRE